MDKEIAAMSKIIEALEDLDPAERKRVLSYVSSKFGIHSAEEVGFTDVNLVADRKMTAGLTTLPETNQQDIRTLKEQKGVSTAIQMAALVAYYLSEVASEGEHRDTIGTAEITKYFKQAGFKLPGRASATLNNAKNAGYLDVAGEKGLYKLNPVGYNLIAFGFTQKGDSSSTTVTKRKKKKSKK